MLTLERAKELNATMVNEESLVIHATNVMAAMGAMAEHFGENVEHWQAIGFLHDYDYEKYPEEHLAHTEENLLAAGALKAPMLKALHATFSWPQLFTALIGGAVALLIVPVIRKAMHK